MALNARLYHPGYSGVTSSSVASFLRRELSADETAAIDDLITEIEIELARSCNRNFLYVDADGEAVQYYDFWDAGVSKFEIINYPMQTVERIELDGAVVYETDGLSNLYMPNTHFWVYPEYVYFSNSLNSAVSNRNAVKIFYTIEQFWGEDVRLAVKRMVANLWLNSENAGIPVTSRSFANMSHQLDTKELERYLEKIVTRYRKINI